MGPDIACGPHCQLPGYLYVATPSQHALGPWWAALLTTERGAIFSISLPHSSKALGPPKRAKMALKGSGPIVAANDPANIQTRTESVK